MHVGLCLSLVFMLTCYTLRQKEAKSILPYGVKSVYFLKSSPATRSHLGVSASSLPPDLPSIPPIATASMSFQVVEEGGDMYGGG